MPVIKAGDLNVYYEEKGQGEPLLLINGIGAELTILRPIIDGLSQKYRVIAFDNRGAGRTDKPDAPYTIPMMARDTAGLMDTLGIGRAHVLGISMGGLIAQELAIGWPERVKSLVLVSACARLSGKGKFMIGRVLRLLHPLANLMLQYPQPGYAYRHQAAAGTSYDSRGNLPRIGAPTIVLHGSRDLLISVKEARVLSDGIPGARLTVFKGGHTFSTDAPAKFNQTVLEFLSTVQ